MLLQFVDTSFDLGVTYTEVIAPQDVATYGGLCALASFDRAELKVCKFLYNCFLCLIMIRVFFLYYKSS